jgi:hypothetical protein
MKKNLSVIDFEKNKENPFLKEAIEQIQQNIVKKYKNSSGTSKKAILQAVDNEGKVLGHTSFIRQFEVDEEQFTKFYLSKFSAFWDLKVQAIRVFGYIMTKLVPKQDTFHFFIDECMEHTNYKSEKSIYIGLASLLDSGIIARGRTDSLYFINPMIAFNGDRVTFANTYIKKEAEKKEKRGEQLDLIEQIKEIEEEKK